VVWVRWVKVAVLAGSMLVAVAVADVVVVAVGAVGAVVVAVGAVGAVVVAVLICSTIDSVAVQNLRLLRAELLR
jgi:hypothetical protein